MAEKTTSTIFIDRTRLQIASSTAGIRSLEYGVKEVKDGKITDASALVNNIDAFVHAQRIQPDQAVVVLGESVCFSQKIQPANEEQREQLTRDFFDAVPCENLIKKEYPLGKETLLVAMDGDFVNPVLDALVRIGFTITSILPTHILGAVGEKRWLDAAFVSYMEKNKAALAQYSIEMPKQSFLETSEQQPIHSHKQTIPWGLIGVFVVLVVVLVILLLTRS